MDNKWSIVASMPAKAPPVCLVPFVVVLRTAPHSHQTERDLASQQVSTETDIMDDSENYTNIENYLIRLMDEEAVAVRVQRKFAVVNRKLRRPALVWSRVTKKLLAMFLLRNDHTGRFCATVLGA